MRVLVNWSGRVSRESRGKPHRHWEPGFDVSSSHSARHRSLPAESSTEPKRALSYSNSIRSDHGSGTQFDLGKIKLEMSGFGIVPLDTRLIPSQQGLSFSGRAKNVCHRTSSTAISQGPARSEESTPLYDVLRLSRLEIVVNRNPRPPRDRKNPPSRLTRTIGFFLITPADQSDPSSWHPHHFLRCHCRRFVSSFGHRSADSTSTRPFGAQVVSRSHFAAYRIVSRATPRLYCRAVSHGLPSQELSPLEHSAPPVDLAKYGGRF